MHRRLMLAAACAALTLPLHAQTWPTKPVHIVVPTGPGSSLDIIARAMGEKLGTRWAQSVVIDNKPGAGGMLGLDMAAKANDGGHTIALGFNGPVAFAPFLYRKMPYDPARDLTPVVMTTAQANVLAVSEKVPAKTVAEFVAWAKAQGGKLNYASLGNGSSAHLTMELFMHEAGFQATHVPYNGSPPAAMSVAQGEADATFMTAPALLPHVRNNKLRLLASSGSARPENLKELPTLVESGYRNVESLAWNGFFVAAATPEAVVQKINADANAVLQDPAVRQTLDSQGLTPAGGSAADFRRTIETEVKRWGPVITRLGVKLD